MNEQNRNRLIDSENRLIHTEKRYRLMVARGEEAWGSGWRLQNRHGPVRRSTGNTVSNSLITGRGQWALEISGEHCVKYMTVEPLCRTPETKTK